MATTEESHRPRYRFGPLEQRGVLAGWRGGQIAAVATGLVAAVLALRTRPSVPGAMVGLACVATGVAAASWPVGGRTIEQWCPTAGRWVLAGVTGRRRWSSDAPGRGRRGPGPDGQAGPQSGGGVFDGVRIVRVAGPHPACGPGAAGAVLDIRARTATVVLSVTGHNFALLGPDEQDGRIGGWSRMLASLAREGSAVHRVQWVETSLPDDGRAVRGHLAGHAVLGDHDEAFRSYAALLDDSVASARRHRVLLAVTVRTGGRRPRAGPDPAAVALREAANLATLLDGAEVAVDGVLGPAALSAVVREAFSDPTAAGGRGAGPSGVPGEPPGNSDPAWPWPMAVAPTWDAVRVDATWHATYWVSEWPRTDVTPDFLGPLLFCPVRRTVAVVMEPVGPVEAARQVARARTADLADGELRRRGGFLVSARRHRERQSVEHRDEELADGHAQFRYSGYVTVSAGDRAALDAARAVVEQAAGQARLELRLLYGEQDSAFACTLPLGRGLS